MVPVTVTATVAVFVTPPIVVDTSTVVEPAPTAVITPVTSSTVATDVLLDLKDGVPITSKAFNRLSRVGVSFGYT